MNDRPRRQSPRLVGASALSGAMICLAAVAALAAQPPSPDGGKATPVQLVDAFNDLFGKQTDNRAIHAKGIVLEGTFTPAPSAASVSKAPHLQSTAVPVTVRFSNFPGVPTLSDTDGLASPRGLAIKFHLPDGSETDIVSHSYNGFPTATSTEFRDLIRALAASPASAAHPTAAEKFLSTHPLAKTFLTTQAPPPVSYGTLPYYGVNSFRFTNARGESRFGRYRFAPEAGVLFLSPDAQKTAGPTYLATEIRERVARGPIRFVLSVQLAGKRDRIADPSLPWPESRKLVELGTLEITRAVDDSEAASRALLFVPTAVPAGIEPADPMLADRSGAYGISYARRHEGPPHAGSGR